MNDNRDTFAKMKQLIHQTQSTPMICVTDVWGHDGHYYHYILAKVSERSFVTYKFEIISNIDSHHNELVDIIIATDMSFLEQLRIWAETIKQKSVDSTLQFYAR